MVILSKFPGFFYRSHPQLRLQHKGIYWENGLPLNHRWGRMHDPRLPAWENHSLHLPRRSKFFYPIVFADPGPRGVWIHPLHGYSKPVRRHEKQSPCPHIFPGSTALLPLCERSPPVFRKRPDRMYHLAIQIIYIEFGLNRVCFEVLLLWTSGIHIFPLTRILIQVV